MSSTRRHRSRCLEAGNECLLGNNMSSRGKNCYGSLLRGSVVPTKFLLVLLNTLFVEDETSNALVVAWERSTLRIAGRDTAQTERILMRLVDTSSLDSRLHHSGKRVFARHPCIESVSFLDLCQCCTHDSSFFLGLYFAHGSGAPGYSVLIHGSTLCRQLKS